MYCQIQPHLLRFAQAILISPQCNIMLTKIEVLNLMDSCSLDRIYIDMQENGSLEEDCHWHHTDAREHGWAREQQYTYHGLIWEVTLKNGIVKKLKYLKS